MERLLQILECLAEDELYFEHDIEIEQIEMVIQVQQKIISKEILIAQQYQQQNNLPRTISSISAKRAVRMSIFTIDEEEDDEGFDDLL